RRQRGAGDERPQARVRKQPVVIATTAIRCMCAGWQGRRGVGSLGWGEGGTGAAALTASGDPFVGWGGFALCAIQLRRRLSCPCRNGRRLAIFQRTNTPVAAGGGCRTYRT